MSTAVHLLILGPVEVRQGETRLPVSARMQRAVLASLVTRKDDVVSVDALIEDLWGAAPPSSARVTLRNYVRRLRRILPEDLLGSSHSGYFLRIAPDQVDAWRMVDLGRQARALADTAPRQAASRYAAALSLWRGTPLLGIGEVPLRTWRAPRLEEDYLAILENSFDLQLQGGAAEPVVAELTHFHSRYPLRERLCGQLMLALYRTGRSAEAAACFRRLRAAMIGRLGVEPGVQLRELQEAILRQDPALLAPGGQCAAIAGAPRAAWTPTAPPPPAVFAGRRELLGELGEFFEALATSSPKAFTCLLHGQGGVGKSAVALQLAQTHGKYFPDGTCYVDLHGSTPGVSALPTPDLLRRLLAGLGGAEPDPGTGTEELARSYRARLSGRRVLLVLDNAVSLTQVLAALPDEPGCAAVVTSRSALGGSESVLRRHVAPLPAEESVELLARIAGSAKVSAEPEPAARLSALCGGLPLAIRVVGGRAALRPHWPLAEWVGLLADSGRRLNELRNGDADVRASLQLSVDNLSGGNGDAEQDAADLFELIGVLPTAGCTPALAAAFTGWPIARAERALAALTDAHLAFSPYPGWYSLHDLAAVLAGERASDRARSDRAAVVIGACRWYLAAARRGSERISGSRSPHGLPTQHRVDRLDTVVFGDVGEATAWLDAEITHIVKLFEEAARLLPAETATLLVPLTQALAFYFNITMRWREREALATVMLNLAEHGFDPRLEPVALAQLVNVEGQRGNLAEAERLAARAQPLFDRADAELDRTGMLMNRSTVVFLLGRTGEAATLCEQAVASAGQHGFTYLEAASLCNLATIRRMCGETDDALRLLERAARIHRDCGNLYGQAMVYNVLLAVHAEQNDHRSVLRYGATALALCDKLGDGYCTAESYARTARSLSALGRDDEAAEHLARAHEVMAAISKRERLKLAPLLENIEIRGSWTVASGGGAAAG